MFRQIFHKMFRQIFQPPIIFQKLNFHETEGNFGNTHTKHQEQKNLVALCTLVEAQDTPTVMEL